MSGSVQWTEITSLVDYTICGPQIKLVLDRPCWSVATKFPKIPTDGWLSQHQLGFLSIISSLNSQASCVVWYCYCNTSASHLTQHYCGSIMCTRKSKTDMWPAYRTESNGTRNSAVADRVETKLSISIPENRLPSYQQTGLSEIIFFAFQWLISSLLNLLWRH